MHGLALWPHLTTLSARYKTDCGIVRPICFAVLRLITSSKLCWLLHREIGRFCAFEDFVHVGSGAATVQWHCTVEVDHATRRRPIPSRNITSSSSNQLSVTVSSTVLSFGATLPAAIFNSRWYNRAGEDDSSWQTGTRPPTQKGTFLWQSLQYLQSPHASRGP